MDSLEHEGNGATEGLPPPPPVPPDVVPLRAEPEHISEPVKKKIVRVPIARRGLGSKGQKIPILTNHFKVNVTNVDGHFFHYSVSVSYEDGRPVDGKGVGRKVIDRVHETYDTELAGKNFAYDGEKSLFTVGPLPRNKLEFTVVLEDVTSNRNNGNGSPGSPNENDRKRMRRPYQSKTFKVEISFAAKIPMQAIANALRGAAFLFGNLSFIMMQGTSPMWGWCSWLQRVPFKFPNYPGWLVSKHRCLHHHMIIQPGPVVDFLIANQNVKDPFQIDWAKAKRVLKNLRVKTSPSNAECKITGLSEKPCKEQMFSLKQKAKDGDGEFQTLEVTVYDYFVNYRHIELRYSADLPCINVGKPKRPTYFPIELCSLVSLQRYTKALSTFQRASLVEKSRQKPQERMRVLTDALKINNYDAEPMLRSCGVSIGNNFTQIEGRVLPAPKKLVDPTKIERWAVVNFSARCDIRGLVRDLIKCGEMKGIHIDAPFDVFEENQQYRRAPPLVRVEKMFENIQSKLPGAPQFLLCLLPERKNSDLYGPWKRKNLSDYGIVTQCIAPTRLGGLNSMLAVEHSPSIPLVSKVPTIILGMDVSHGSPGQSDIPSIAAVVSSRNWPLISRYRACVRTQSPKVEMIDSLFKRVSDTEDEGIIRYQRSTTAISVVAPICYAHLAATQMGQFMKFEDASETSSSHGGLTSAGAVPVPQMPKLQESVCNSMFFC
ncbi:argonaute family protein [Actinidia rufa]|uniref:Argonaute family protein n=1 Tax=Actinidia rufa TaxID=165716 RepID=A0A7J0H4S5_9ERIC|nr:argonaute family protein [Actinidia rufa]